MSWTPPHPVSGGPPAPGPYGGQPYPMHPAPHHPAAAPAPAPPKRSRPGLLVLLIALPLVLIIGASAALVSTLNTDKQLSDNQDRVTITVPGTWSNDTTDDAGQRVEQGKGGEDSYTVPDLETSGWTGSVVVFVDDRATTSVADAHRTAVDEECQMTGCISRGQPARVEVHGRPGTEQILRHLDEEATVVLTLESDAFVVTVLGYSVEEDRPAIQEMMRTVAISR